MFVEWNEQILKKLPQKLSVWSQLDAASTSIVVMNSSTQPSHYAKEFQTVSSGKRINTEASSSPVLTWRAAFSKSESKDGPKF